MTQPPITYKQELLRKTIHLASLIIPISYAFLEKDMMIKLLFSCAVIWIALDVLRCYIKPLSKLTTLIFGKMLRVHEANRLSGASYMLLSACLCILPLPKIVFITAFAILSVSDTAAALIGRRFGKHRYLDKSVEGTLAFMISAMIVISIIGLIINANPLFYGVGLVVAIISAHVELISNRIHVDDNFSIPLSIGAIMCGAKALGVL